MYFFAEQGHPPDHDLFVGLTTAAGVATAAASKLGLDNKAIGLHGRDNDDDINPEQNANQQPLIIMNGDGGVGRRRGSASPMEDATELESISGKKKKPEQLYTKVFHVHSVFEDGCMSHAGRE